MVRIKRFKWITHLTFERSSSKLETGRFIAFGLVRVNPKSPLELYDPTSKTTVQFRVGKRQRLPQPMTPEEIRGYLLRG